MSRRPAPVGPAISLFPFLAVLLCTMGSLLVLLVLFSNSAQQADTAAEVAAARQHEEVLELARDELAWRLDQLRGVRERTAEELARVRLQLAGIEADGRGLADEFEQLEQTAAALAEPGEADDDPQAIADLEQGLAAARDALEEAREQTADRPPAYAVVPFAGPGGTHRRPLYIECCIDGVFLQPEGIRLGPADFEGPPGPGNPLASGLRAAREHLASGRSGSGELAVQPYPLLIVRPSGVMAYYAAREALQSWGSDFGYQFIDEDWTLSFPPADPALAEAEQRAVDEARRRLEWLAQVRPRQRSKPAVQYRAATTRGGVVATGGPTVLGDQSRWDWTEEQAAAGRGFRADGGSGGRGDAVLGGGGGTGSSGSDQTGSGSGGEQFLGPSKFYGGSGAGSGLGERGTGGPGAGGPGLAGEQAGLGPADNTSAFENGAGGASGLADGGTGPGGTGPGGTGPGEHADNGSFAGADGGNPASGGAGGLADGSGSPGAAGGAAGQAAGSTGGGGGSFGPTPPGLAGSQPQVAAGAGGQECPSGSCSLAGRRGSNWASLASQDRPIPLTRPIRLECTAEEFRILGSGGRVTARVPIGTDTAEAVDPLVQQVHTAVGGWGMAGDRMYWKPELVLSATPDGVGRRDDLEQLLADSGLDTRRAGDADTVRELPPVRRARGLSFPR